MILSDRDIKREIGKGRIVITPYDESLVGPCSVDFRLGDSFSRVVLNEGFDYLDASNPDSFKTVPVSKGEDYIMEPGEFIIAHTLESLDIPADIAVVIKGKSSVGRIGIGNSHHAGLVDLGWRGVLTLEIVNDLNVRNILRVGSKIGQFIFLRAETHAERPYNLEGVGRYTDQLPGQGSKGI